MATMERWSDARLDDLNERVTDMGRRMDAGFEQVAIELRGLRAEMKSELGGLRKELCGQISGLRGEFSGLRGGVRGEIGGLRDEVRGEISGLRSEISGLRDDVWREIGALQRLVLQVSVGMFATLTIGFIGLIVAQS